MFVAENYICFFATVLGVQTKKVIGIEDVVQIEKKQMLGIFNNSIQITTKHTSYLFSSFNNREQSYRLLYTVWKGESPDDGSEDPQDSLRSS